MKFFSKQNWTQIHETSINLLNEFSFMFWKEDELWNEYLVKKGLQNIINNFGENLCIFLKSSCKITKKHQICP